MFKIIVDNKYLFIIINKISQMYILDWFGDTAQCISVCIIVLSTNITRWRFNRKD